MGLKWLQNYMYDRKQVVVNGGQESSKQTIICGVPQGSILGPLLFIIYMNDMARLPLTSNLLLFADDTYTTTIDALETCMQLYRRI